MKKYSSGGDVAGSRYNFPKISPNWAADDADLLAIKDLPPSHDKESIEQVVAKKLAALDTSSTQEGVYRPYAKEVRTNVKNKITNTRIAYPVRSLGDFPGFSDDDLEVLRCFLNNLPKRPYCTNNVDLGVVKGWCRSGFKITSNSLVGNPIQHRKKPLPVAQRPRSLMATDYALIQFNKHNLRKWLAFDLDYDVAAYSTRLATRHKLAHPSSWWMWDVLKLPAPSLVMINPANGHAHVLYGLETPVYYGENARRHVIAYCENIAKVLRTALRADAAYTGLICKNPFCSAWEVCVLADLYDLDTLRHQLTDAGLKVPHYRQQFIRTNSFAGLEAMLHEYGFLGRNWYLFNWLRLTSYSLWSTWSGDYAGWKAHVLAHARTGHQAMCADFGVVALPSREVEQVAAKVAKWVWEKSAKITKPNLRGILGFGPNRSNYNFDIPYRDSVVAKRQSAAGCSFVQRMQNVTRDQQAYAAMVNWTNQWRQTAVNPTMATLSSALYQAKSEIASALKQTRWPKRLTRLLFDQTILQSLWEQKPLPENYFGTAQTVATTVLKTLRRTTDKRHQLNQ